MMHANQMLALSNEVNRDLDDIPELMYFKHLMMEKALEGETSYWFRGHISDQLINQLVTFGYDVIYIPNKQSVTIKWSVS